MALLREHQIGSMTPRAAAEHRTKYRTRTLKGAKIIFNDGSCVIDCMLRNTSATGACIEIPSLAGIPDRFTLLVKPDSIHHECRVAWKSATRMGVAFIG